MEKVERKKVVLRQCPICGGQVDPRTLTDEMVMMPAEMLASLQSRAERAEAMLKNVFFVSAKLYSRLNKTSKDGSQLENELQQFAKYYAEWIQENEDEYA